jgi:cytochrome c peroxidase
MNKSMPYVLAIVACASLGGCTSPEDDLAAALDIPASPAPGAGSIFPVPTEQDLSTAIVSLGRELYHENRISDSQRISCASCHPVDGTGTNPSAGDGESYYDIPTIFNVGGHFAYFWNGRTESLERAIRVSVQAENTMSSSWPTIAAMLASDPTYVERFSAAYPDAGVTEDTAIDALATYVRSLTTPNAPFDRWLNGESLSPSALAGYELFTAIGCIRCHQGASVGGNMYATFQGYIESRENQRTTDLGRFNITNDEAHRYQFKVPGLRNVAVTAPYFHDGSTNTLADAVDAMARHQLDRELERSEINQIVSFLESLTGERDGATIGETQ